MFFLEPDTTMYYKASQASAQFHRAAKHKNVLRMKFFASIKTELSAKLPHDFQDEQTTAEYH